MKIKLFTIVTILLTSYSQFANAENEKKFNIGGEFGYGMSGHIITHDEHSQDRLKGYSGGVFLGYNITDAIDIRLNIAYDSLKHAKYEMIDNAVGHLVGNDEIYKYYNDIRNRGIRTTVDVTYSFLNPIFSPYIRVGAGIGNIKYSQKYYIQLDQASAAQTKNIENSSEEHQKTENSDEKFKNIEDFIKYCYYKDKLYSLMCKNCSKAKLKHTVSEEILLQKNVQLNTLSNNSQIIKGQTISKKNTFVYSVGLGVLCKVNDYLHLDFGWAMKSLPSIQNTTLPQLSYNSNISESKGKIFNSTAENSLKTVESNRNFVHSFLMGVKFTF